MASKSMRRTGEGKRKTDRKASRQRSARDLPARRASDVKGGGVSISPIVVTKPIDKSTPLLS